MALLEVSQVSVRFGGVAAVTDVSMAVETGEIHGLIGPNGAGKTSLINAMTGMVPAAAGSIRFDGEELHGRSPHAIAASGLGRTFQHVELFRDRTVLENVLTGFYRHQDYGLFAAAVGWGRAARAERQARQNADRLLDAFDLTPFREVQAGELPFGIQKRVDLARALAAGPRLLLLDEPVSGMSESEADAAVSTIRRLASDQGITLLIVEHNMRVLMRLVGRVTVLNQGRLLASGSPETIRANPAVVDAYLGEES